LLARLELLPPAIRPFCRLIDERGE
jgi:hypothetical protein